MAMTEAKKWGFEGRTLAILTLCKASRAPGGTGFALQSRGDETVGQRGQGSQALTEVLRLEAGGVRFPNWGQVSPRAVWSRGRRPVSWRVVTLRLS